MGELFGVRIPSPREMFDGAVAAGASTAQSLSDGASRLGGSALEQASNLGRAIDTGVRDAGRVVDGAISDAQTWAQNGVRDGVHWTGQQIHAGAETVRQAVGDDTLAGQVVGGGVTWAENNARFTVGVVGGVANEAVGLVGTVATVASTGVQVQLSLTRRDEVGAAVAEAVSSGADTVYRYGQTVAADPGRLLSDVQAAGQGVVDHYQTAIAEGRGPEAFGMTTGQVLTYVVPVGAGANVARTGLAGATRLTSEAAEVVAREGTEILAREGAEAAVREGAEAGGRVVQPSTATPRVAAEALGPVRPLEVGTYGDLAPRSVKDGLTPDHIPSFAAVRTRVEADLGRELTPAEARDLRNNTNTVIIDTDIHQGVSATYGGRNTKAQIAADALDLRAAVERDHAALREALIERGYDPGDIDSAFEALHRANEADGLY